MAPEAHAGTHHVEVPAPHPPKGDVGVFHRGMEGSIA